MRVGVRFAVLILGGAACSGLGLNFREPDIQLDHAVVRGIDLTGGNLDLVVKVQNPNNFTLQGTRLQVGFDVEGSHLGGSAVRAALGYGELPYTMKGQATIRLPGGLTTSVSFTHEGRAPLTRAGTVAIPGVGPS